MQRGAVRALRDDPDAAHEGGGDTAPRDEGAVALDGFSLHVSVAIAAASCNVVITAGAVTGRRPRERLGAPGLVPGHR